MRLKATLVMTAVLALAGLATAQTVGTITVTGSVPNAASVTTTADAALSATVALGSLLPMTGGTLTTSDGTPVQIRLRSNKNYSLSAQATAFTAPSGDPDGGTTMGLSDVGFGVRAAALTGAHVAYNGARAGSKDTITSGFDYTGGWPAVSGGLTPFNGTTYKTLNEITSDTAILTGSRISTLGNISTTDNFILITLGVGTLPQYFTPNTSFSSTITLTLTTP